MADLEAMRRSAQFRRDQNKRQRYSKHQTFMNKMAGDPKWATRRGRYTPGMDDNVQGGGGGAPALGEAPKLEMPEYDEDKVSSLTQKRAAPAIRRLRETTQQATSGTYDNPNVKKMTVREALAGYGTGLEGVVAGAGRAAAAEYGDQYAASVNAEMAKYQAALNRQSQEYEVRSRDWLMGRENEYWKERQDYDDPYAAFDAFYG